MISKIRRLEIAQFADNLTRGTALPVNPLKIAQARDITVRAIETKQDGVSGFLMKQGDAFGIGYSTRIANQGFINFTIAHELGHYFLPGHVERLFSANSGVHASRSGFVANDPCEEEADLFAATLLMPEQQFLKALREAGHGFPAVERLASQCVTSITATAVRFAEFSEDPIMTIVSSDGIIEFACLSPHFRELDGITWLKRGDAVPGASSTARFHQNRANILNGCRSKGHSMLDEWLEGAPRIEMKEDVVGLGHYGKSLTVLFTDELVEADDSEEPEDSYDRCRRWDKEK